ncbi:MAG: hypothetical protein GY768_05040 [Planctomycetaceae bacterium]|nr:hypothetical protein [Planctomycetaceae bacterium]
MTPGTAAIPGNTRSCQPRISGGSGYRATRTAERLDGSLPLRIPLFPNLVAFQVDTQAADVG